MNMDYLFISDVLNTLLNMAFIVFMFSAHKRIQDLEQKKD